MREEGTENSDTEVAPTGNLRKIYADAEEFKNIFSGHRYLWKTLLQIFSSKMF